MLEATLNDDKFFQLMEKHLYECIDYLLNNKTPFSIVANLSHIKFSPDLPSEIKSKFGKSILLTLAGYTFDSAILSKNHLTFEAGFGTSDYASKLTIPLGAIVQIILEDTPILLNFSIYKDKKSGVEKSKELFASNPNNKI